MPSDANVVKSLMKQNLLGVFSEHDAEKRRSLIAKIWEQRHFHRPRRPLRWTYSHQRRRRATAAQVSRFCILRVGGWRRIQRCRTPPVGLRPTQRATEDDWY